MEGTRFTPHLPLAHGAHLPPQSLDQQEEGGCLAAPHPFPQSAAFPCCSQFPALHPQNLLLPLQTHTHRHPHTLLRIP